MTYTKFDVWKESEAIAMHFNTLLMQLRLRALAAVGFIVSLSGVIGKGSQGEFNWTIMSFVLLVLLISWIAIYLIDTFYYKRLLLGAVASIIEIEESTVDEEVKLNLSTKVKEKASANWPVNLFYILTGGMLLILLCISLSFTGILGTC